MQVYLAGNQGEALANESVDAVRDIVDHTPPPPGVKAYVTGAAPLITDQFEVGSHGTAKVTLITLGVIALMLLFVYRSVVTTLFWCSSRCSSSCPRPAASSPSSANCRHHRAVDVLDQSADAAGDRRRNRLRDLLRRPLSRSALRRARIAKRRSTRCTTAPRTSSWVRA